MTCPHCAQFLRKFYRAGAWVRVCPKCQPPVIRRNAVPTADLLALRGAGMSYRDIGRRVDMPFEAVKSRIQKLRNHAANLEAAA